MLSVYANRRLVRNQSAFCVYGGYSRLSHLAGRPRATLNIAEKEARPKRRFGPKHLKYITEYMKIYSYIKTSMSHIYLYIYMYVYVMSYDAK